MSLDLDRLDSWVARLLLGDSNSVMAEMQAVLDLGEVSRLEGICPLAREMMEEWAGTKEVRRVFLGWLQAAQALETYERLWRRFTNVSGQRVPRFFPPTEPIILSIKDGFSYVDPNEPHEQPIQVDVTAFFYSLLLGVQLSYMVPSQNTGYGLPSGFIPWPTGDGEESWIPWFERVVEIIYQAPRVAWEKGGVRICRGCGHEHYQGHGCRQCERIEELDRE